MSVYGLRLHRGKSGDTIIKSTFYNLSEEKKKRLFDAAKNEFSRAPFYEASINKIIKEAGISRGSFYTYFDDKYDIAAAMLSEYHKLAEEQVNAALVSSSGDIFQLFLILYDMTMSYTEMLENMEFFHTIFKASQDASGSDRGTRILDIPKKRNHIKELAGQINRENLRFDTDEDVEMMIDLLFSISRKAMIFAMENPENQEKARSRLVKQIEIIKNGANKKAIIESEENVCAEND